MKPMMGCLLFLTLFYSTQAVAFTWKDLWLRQDQQAQQAFNQGQIEKAADQFKDPSWQGATQYDVGQFTKAVETLSK